MKFWNNKNGKFPFNNKGLLTLASFGAKVAGTLGIAGPVTQGTALALGTATAGAGAFAAVKGTQLLTKSLLPDIPITPPQPLAQAVGPTPTIESAREQSREETLELIRRKRAGTILTSPQGSLLDPSSVVGKSLLGG